MATALVAVALMFWATSHDWTPNLRGDVFLTDMSLNNGTEVKVLDGGGAIIATSTITYQGTETPPTTQDLDEVTFHRYSFLVNDLPRRPMYAIYIGESEPVWYSRSELAAEDFDLRLYRQ